MQSASSASSKQRPSTSGGIGSPNATVSLLRMPQGAARRGGKIDRLQGKRATLDAADERCVAVISRRARPGGAVQVVDVG
jgi:hypothetical protein